MSSSNALVSGLIVVFDRNKWSLTTFDKIGFGFKVINGVGVNWGLTVQSQIFCRLEKSCFTHRLHGYKFRVGKYSECTVSSHGH